MVIGVRVSVHARERGREKIERGERGRGWGGRVRRIEVEREKAAMVIHINLCWIFDLPKRCFWMDCRLLLAVVQW